MSDRDASIGPFRGPAETGTPARGSDDPVHGVSAATPTWLERNLPLSLDAYERAALERALVQAWGDASEAAKLLGIGRSTFYRKAGKHGINLGELRAPQPCAAPDAPGPPVAASTTTQRARGEDASSSRGAHEGGSAASTQGAGPRDRSAASIGVGAPKPLG